MMYYSIKKFKRLLILSLLFPTVLYSQKADSISTLEKGDAHLIYRSYHNLLFDATLSMRSGIESLNTIHYGLSLAEDRLIGIKWFPEDNFLGKTGGVLGRLTKYVFLDFPTDYFTNVLAHEYSGHGARYRELGWDNIYYRFDLPPPYGNGGGEATNTLSRETTLQEVMAIWTGGIEVNALMNREISLNWVSNQGIYYRDASLYLWSWQMIGKYIQSTPDKLSEIESENDPSAYVRYLNQYSGYNDPENPLMDIDYLKSRCLVNVFSPFLFYSFYTLFKTYIYDGNSVGKLPMINIKNVKYLPAARTGFTPFGLEYHFENYLRYKNMSAIIDLRFGDKTFYKSWGGGSIMIRNFYETRRLSLDMNVDVWKQPELELIKDNALATVGGSGPGLSFRGNYDITTNKNPIVGILELDYKTPGFVEGYDLGATPIFMFGIGIRH